MNYEKFLHKLKKSIQKYAKEKLGYTRAPSFHNVTRYSDFDIYTFKNCDAYVSLKIDKYFPEIFEDKILDETITKLMFLISRMIDDVYFNGYILRINNPYFVAISNNLNTSTLNVKLNDNIYKLDNDDNYMNKYLLGLKTFLSAGKNISVKCSLLDYMYDDIDFLYVMHLSGDKILYNKRNTIIDNEISLRDIIEIVKGYERINKGYIADVSIINQNICISITIRGRSTILKIKCDSFKININDFEELLRLQVKHTKNIVNNTNKSGIVDDAIIIKSREDVNKLKLQVLF